MILRNLALACSVALLLTACGKNKNATPTPTPTPTPDAGTNAAPAASNVSIEDDNGAPRAFGDTLRAKYTYSDAESDDEGATSFQWLRDGVDITGATSRSYTLTTADVGRVITVAVTPIAITGQTSGSSVVSVNAPATAAAFTSSDPLISDQWYLKNTGIAPADWGNRLTKLTENADQGVLQAWEQGATGEGITVTVIDDGLDFSHGDLQNQENPGHSYAFEEGKESIIVLPVKPAQSDPVQESERNDHGTSCAGIIAAESNNTGVVGIAPKAKLVGLRMLGIEDSTDSASNNFATKILTSAVSTVSNHSYGESDNGLLHPQSAQDYNNYKILAEGGGGGSTLKDHVILIAAGNGRDQGDYAGLDMAQQHPYVLSVSGFTSGDTEVSYAEAGPATLVAGTTGDEDKGYPRMTTTGRTSEDYNNQDDMQSPYHFDSSHRMNTDKSIPNPMPLGYTASFNGTSASAPSVTGVVALIRSVNAELSWRDVRWILARTARKINVTGTTANEVIGEDSGTVPLWSAGGNQIFGKFSHHFGYGAVNADAAVKMARNPGYTVLPPMKTCVIAVTGSASSGYSADPSSVTAESCPSVIEFVQVDVQQEITDTPRNVSDMVFSMVYGASLTSADKEARLLVKTTCGNLDEDDNDLPCEISSTTSWQTGTTAYLGDELKTDGTKKFLFSETNLQSENVPYLTPQKITVYGF